MKYLFSFLISLLILIIVLIPGSNLPDVNFIGFDKIVHIGLFGLWALAIRHDFDKGSFNFFVAFIAGIAFSLFTEVLQLFVEGRSFDWFDMVADAIGLLISLAIGGKILSLLGWKQ